MGSPRENLSKQGASYRSSCRTNSLPGHHPSQCLATWQYLLRWKMGIWDIWPIINHFYPDIKQSFQRRHLLYNHIARWKFHSRSRYYCLQLSELPCLPVPHPYQKGEGEAGSAFSLNSRTTSNEIVQKRERERILGKHFGKKKGRRTSLTCYIDRILKDAHSCKVRSTMPMVGTLQWQINDSVVLGAFHLDTPLSLLI